jgi:hypothetical protein
MQPSKFKLVYSNWVEVNGRKIPLANGLHPEIVAWMKSLTKDSSRSFSVNMSNRIEDFENNFQTPGSGVNFRQGSFLYYFIKHFDFEYVIEENEINESDDYIYFLPYEIELGNMNHLYESFRFYVDGTEHIYNFKDTVSPKIIELIANGKVKLVLAYPTEPTHSIETLNKLAQSLNELGIDSDNVYYVAGNNLRNYSGKINLISSQASLQQQAEIAHRYPIEASSLGYQCDYPKITELDSNRIRPKRFLSWNRTMNRPHRLAIAHLALKYNLLPDSLFSFLNFFPENADEYLGTLINNENLSEIAQNIKSLIPYEVDTQSLNEQGRQSFQTNENNKKEFYTDTYLHITSETLFDATNTPFLSEKTFRPILNLQPFIYVGNYKGLEMLRNLGFKTFDGYIDERYDQEQDPKTRFSLIEKEVARFATMTIKELHDWYFSLTDILIYNQQHFLSWNKFNPYQDLFARF